VKTRVIGCVAVCAALSPALAHSQVGGFQAVDFEWLANGGPAKELTIAPGETVTFAYPAGGSFHNVRFRDGQPAACSGVPPANPAPGWEGSCRFDEPGSYAFICEFHPGMTGRVIVSAPATPTPTPSPTSTPTPTATPAPATLKLTLARNQRSMRVRGAVEVQQAGSRVEVTARTSRRVGRFLRRSAAAGTVVFSVGLDAKARKTLRAKGRLRVTVRVALSPPGAQALTRTTKVTLTRG
jgi:plastocyanin